MPVGLESLLEKGWDKNNVKHAANDPVLVAVFRDEKTGRILFKYAPKLIDLAFWIKLFGELGEIEQRKAQNCEVCKNTKMAETHKDD